jgi:ATP-dependent DNA helicase RecG
MTFKELKQITKQREKRTIEYKEAWSELPGNLFETVCAFLNRDGGVIVLGAHDDGSISEGVNPRAIDQMCKNIANVSNNSEILKPSFLLQPEIVDVEDNRQVIVIQVPASSQAHRFKNKFYDRSVDGDFELRTDAEISALYLRKSSGYTENTIYPYLRFEQPIALTV